LFHAGRRKNGETAVMKLIVGFRYLANLSNHMTPFLFISLYFNRFTTCRLLAIKETNADWIHNTVDWSSAPFVHHHHISLMQLGHLLTSSGLTYPEVSSKVYYDSFCQLVSSVSLPWVICFETFYLHVVQLLLLIQATNTAKVLKRCQSLDTFDGLWICRRTTECHLYLIREHSRSHRRFRSMQVLYAI